VVESFPVEIRPLFENPGNLKPGKNKPGPVTKLLLCLLVEISFQILYQEYE